MASVLAIVSKKVFDRDFDAGLGETVPTTTYASAHPSLAKLADGGDLFLVTVAPGEELWLAGVLEQPKFQKDKWVAKANTAPIRDITALIPKLAFENGKGLTARAGALAMSLQSPRTLAESDVALLRGGKSVATAKAVVAKVGKVVAAKTANITATPVAPVAPKSTKHLSRAQECLDGGDVASALDELLKAWAQHRAAEIADLVDDLGAHVARALPPIETKKTVIDGAWRDVGDQLRPVDVPRLLAAFEHGSSGQLEGWLEILDRFPVDPRICRGAIDASIEFVASSAGPTRTRANRLAEKIADGRCLPQIDKLIRKRLDAWNAKELNERLRKLKTKFAPPPALAKEDKATVVALAKTIAKLAKGAPPDAASLVRATKASDDDGSRLLAEVLADPEAEAPRLVYADWLQQHEDPRGELIALQLQPSRTPAQDDRIKKLVKTHGKTWLGPLAAVVSDPVFERGFLAACTVELVSEKHRKELLLHPLWATVKRVMCNERAVVESPAMKSLRTVRKLPIEELGDLARRKGPLAIEALEWVRPFDDEDAHEAWEALCAVGAFTKLRSLGLSLPYSADEYMGIALEGWKPFFGTRLGKQLERLHLGLGRDAPRVADWLGAFALSKSLTTLAFTEHVDQTVEIRRDGKRFAIAYELRDPIWEGSVRREMGDAMSEFFEGFPSKLCPQLDIVVPTKISKPQLAAVDAHFRALLATKFERVTIAAR
ncbi:MAG: TIGR02996 domain-containing protein [Myxococcota bacterium]|nr:TIGR02996 domain-containing protein [Myxococcota bacterium]